MYFFHNVVNILCGPYRIRVMFIDAVGLHEAMKVVIHGNRFLDFLNG